MNLDLNNKVAVVTGASRGIGREVSLALSQEGMDVALVARGSSELEQLAARLRASGRKALPLAYDLRDRRAAETIIEAAVREFGKIDLLVNNAGDTKGGRFFDLSDDDWALGFELKVFGYVRMSRAAWPQLRQSKGLIVNIIGSNSRAGKANYTIGGAANASLVNFTKSLADLGQTDGVRVNAINPGLTLTDRWRNRLETAAKQGGISFEDACGQAVAQWGVLRFAQPKEIADMVAFLASHRASYLQGAIIDIDGGYNRAV